MIHEGLQFQQTFFSTKERKLYKIILGKNYAGCANSQCSWLKFVISTQCMHHKLDGFVSKMINCTVFKKNLQVGV